MVSNLSRILCHLDAQPQCAQRNNTRAQRPARPRPRRTTFMFAPSLLRVLDFDFMSLKGIPRIAAAVARTQHIRHRLRFQFDIVETLFKASNDAAFRPVCLSNTHLSS